MKNSGLFNSLFIISFLTVSFQFKALDWGFFGHRQINEKAVFTLPPDLINFYKPNIDFVKEHAIDPDKRRYASKYEAVRHFINPDEIDTYPFEVFPREWSEALAKFTDIYLITSQNDTLHLFGRFQMDFQDDVIVVNSKDLPKAIDKNQLILDKYQYLQFIQRHIVQNYYESEWLIPNEVFDSVFVADSVLIPLKVEVQKVFAVDRLSEMGILPWHLQMMQSRLTLAFEEGDVNKILSLSADFGHYIADAHVPLHTTKNYNGQYTNQRGIHGFWESRLPELFANESYDFFVGKAEYIEDVTEHYWNIILESNRLVDSVLLIEKSLRQQFDEDEIYCYESVGNTTVRTYCRDFAAAYHQRMEGMVEARMKKAIKAVGDAWFTAWVDAGQPNLVKQQVVLTEEERKELEETEKAFQNGKIIGQEHGN
jgi:hypothetical protein